jgi:hypothetical protein
MSYFGDLSYLSCFGDQSDSGTKSDSGTMSDFGAMFGTMSDYRNLDLNYRDPEDPFRDDAKMDPDVGAANAAWGGIAAALLLAVVLAAAFGIGHRPGGIGTNTASNYVMPPATIHMAPPMMAPPMTVLPATAPPSQATPSPGAPAAQGTGR